MTTLLALDTATEACSVALLHDGEVLSHYEVIPRLHAQRLLPMIQTLTAEAGIALSAADAGPALAHASPWVGGRGSHSLWHARRCRSRRWPPSPSAPTASTRGSRWRWPPMHEWMRSTGAATEPARARCSWPASKRWCRR